jgi:hypothetical protein
VASGKNPAGAIKGFRGAPSRFESAMTGDAYPLSKEEIRADAIEILSALHTSRNDRAAYQDNWRRLWQLMREVKTAGVPFPARDGGSWHYQEDGVGGPIKGSAALAAGEFALPVWPPEEPRSPTELPELLNWAGVSPDVSDRGCLPRE